MTQRLVAFMPVEWASTGYGVPTVCARHGREQVKRIEVTVGTPTPGWAWALLVVLGPIPYLIVRAAVRHTVMLPEWPWCQKCARSQLMRMLLPGVVLILSMAFIVGAFTVLAHPRWILVGLLLIPTAVVLAILATRARVAGAKLTPDRRWVRIARCSPEFEAQFAPFRERALADAQKEMVTATGHSG